MRESIFDLLEVGRKQPEDRPIHRGLRRIAAALALAVVLLGAPDGLLASQDARLWRALGSNGHVALLRHAIAPGTGDPPEFSIGDCGTQRNLSGQGREQAARIGALIRANGIEAAQIFSSQWCRCLETAQLLGLGPVEALPSLNSFFQSPERQDRQNRALKEWLASQDLERPLVLVTHQVNITALTGVYPTSGELVVIRRSESGEITVLGSIEAD
jgi:phosphohistidine phosphatase SixA